MTLRADNLQTTNLFNAFSELDVRSSSGHICRNRDSAPFSGFRNDFRLALMKLCIENVMITQSFFLKTLTEFLRRLNADCADQNRLSLFMGRADILYNCGDFLLMREIYGVIMVDPAHRFVCRDLHYIQTVDVLEFSFFGLCCTSHAGCLFIFIEIILNRDRCQSHALSAYFHAFLGLDCLMQTVGISTPGHDTACKLIYDHNFLSGYVAVLIHLVANYVIFISVHQIICTQRKVDNMLFFKVFRVCQVLDTQHPLYLGNALFRQDNMLFLFINDVVTGLFHFRTGHHRHTVNLAFALAALQSLDNHIANAILLCRLISGA